VITDFLHAASEEAFGVAVQPNDGKVIAVGNTSQGANGHDFAVARYNTNGALDSSFGPDHNGRVTIDFGSPSDYASGVTVQADGKILVVGITYDASTGRNDFAVARLTSAGDPDPAFGHDGLVTIGFDVDANWAYRALLQGDKIIVTGGVNGDSHALVRLNSGNGSVDDSFGTDGNGRIVMFIGGLYGDADDALQADGKIVIAGNNHRVVRLDSNGGPDNSFVVPPLDFTAYVIAIDRSDNILIAGRDDEETFTHQDFVVARLSGTDGSPDTSFGAVGEQHIDFDSEHENALGLAVQADSKIVVVGWTTDQTGLSHIAVARLTTNGDLDTSFGSGSRVITDFDDDAFGSFGGVALGPDGGIIIPGTSLQPDTNYDFAVARLIGITDTDQDGIDDFVDTQLTTSSNDFSDGTTTGSVVSRGDQTLTIVNALDPTLGVVITASAAGGSTPATISVDNGAATVSLGAGDQVIVTHGVLLDVLAGSPEATFVAANGQVARATLTAGTGLTFGRDTRTFIAPATNTETVHVVVNGGQLSVAPGQTVRWNLPPVANAGGPYSVVQGGSVRLDASASSDPDQPSTTLTYRWDLDGDGVFGETGAAATRGDEIGPTPTFSADGLDAPLTLTVRLRVTDDGGLSDEAEATVHVVQVLLQADPCNPGQTALAVGGTSGNDTIVVNPAGGNAVSVNLNGVSLGTFSPTGRILVYGQAGNDDIQVAGGISLSAWLYGGAGNDRLKGGNGNNILLGGAGDDLLVGGNARDILIGGTGADRLVGNAEDDILIAGSTAFDGNEAALCAVLREWTSARSYAARVANLMGTGSGTDFANRLNGNFFLKTDGSGVTVFDDGSADVLTGSSGQDWYFANLAGSSVHDKITDLSAAEFAQDLAFIQGP
jgi:uncharacterized delta-60 repeat protein